MIFNSFSYLIFFPVVTLLYFVLPRKIRWVWLLVSSYYFYMNWHAEYALLMAASTLVTYICALAVSRIAKPKARKAVLVGGIRVGPGAKIGEVAFLHTDVPAGATVVSPGARIIERREP